MSDENNTKLELTDTAEFTWTWTHKFFLETAKGNFIWSDPDYPGGDNTIKRFKGTLEDFFKGSYGRDKGTRTIGGYCGTNVKILDD